MQDNLDPKRPGLPDDIARGLELMAIGLKLTNGEITDEEAKEQIDALYKQDDDDQIPLSSLFED